MTDKNTIDEIVENLKKAVAEGNVHKIVIKNKAGKEVANFPVNAGIVGGVLGLAAAPWAVIAAAIGGLGFGFTISVQKEDGSVVDVFEDDVTVEDVFEDETIVDDEEENR